MFKAVHQPVFRPVLQSVMLAGRGVPTWTPADCPGLVGWWDHRTGVTLIGSEIDEWAASNDPEVFVNGSGPTRPTLVATGVRFTAASSQRLTGSAVATLGAEGALIVVYSPRTDHQGTLLSKASGSAHNLTHLAGNATIRFSTNTSSLDMAVTAPAVGTRRILIAQGNASGRELWVNNVAGGTSAASFGGFTVDDFGMYRATAGFFSNSDVEHVVLCSQMMDATARANLQSWFAAVAP